MRENFALNKNVNNSLKFILWETVGQTLEGTKLGEMKRYSLAEKVL